MRVKIRHIVQGAFFLLIALIAINHNLEESGKSIPIIASASLHAVCPFGSVVSMFDLVTSGTFIKKVHESSMVLLVVVMALSVFFGPVFCSWMCPLGSVQEWIKKIGKKLRIRTIKVPTRLDEYLRYARYFVLIWLIYVTAKSGELIFTKIDPYYTLFNFWTGEVVIQGGIILAIVLLLSLIIDRPWCKYACPFGALLGIFNKFRLFKIKRNEYTCVLCGECNNACPMNIAVDENTIINDHQCISCLECTSEQACPIDETVEMILGGDK